MQTPGRKRKKFAPAVEGEKRGEREKQKAYSELSDDSNWDDDDAPDPDPQVTGRTTPVEPIREERDESGLDEMDAEKKADGDVNEVDFISTPNSQSTESILYSNKGRKGQSDVYSYFMIKTTKMKIQSIKTANPGLVRTVILMSLVMSQRVQETYGPI
jgi:hypothetical protein